MESSSRALEQLTDVDKHLKRLSEVILVAFYFIRANCFFRDTIEAPVGALDPAVSSGSKSVHTEQFKLI